ncbi:hypothetical protein [Raineya orbicola]|uniref:Uncharacterized protein n=1 Tax=Raineya orbicola TaxID=2016530 RepID=A0A2N3IHX4_9BACT|nr:hypothetical protein [Raineya orbicola]PKQ69823.1 hypothetical protein Rain11_1158 [Raineya orbicola]
MNLQEIALFFDTPIFVVPEYDASISALLANCEAEILFLFETEVDTNTQNAKNQKVLDSMLKALAEKQKNSPSIENVEKEILTFPEKRHIYWDFSSTKVKYVVVFGENTAKNIGLQVEKYSWQKWKGVWVLLTHSLQEIETQKIYKNLIWQTMTQMFQ